MSKTLLVKIDRLKGQFFKDGHMWFKAEQNQDAGKDKHPIFKGDGIAIWVQKEEKPAPVEEII